MDDTDVITWIEQHIGIDRYLIRLQDKNRTWLVCDRDATDPKAEVLARDPDLNKAISKSLIPKPIVSAA